MLSSDPEISIAGEAANGSDAADRVLALKPDIVIMDIDMPIMNGLEATARIARASSIPVLIFTRNEEPELPFKAIERGAADFLLKPDFNDINRPDYVTSFIARLRALASRHGHAPVATRERQSSHETKAALAEAAPRDLGLPSPSSEPCPSRPSPAMIAVGASTGGPQAVSSLLSSLKAPFPLPITLVQHIETGFDKGYADWLSDQTGHRVILAKPGEEPRPGTVYVAPTDLHLIFSDSGFVLDDGLKVQNQKPSVDVLFRSAAERYGSHALGILLTGMGSDGAEGCAAIQAKKGFTVVQDEASSLIFGMPRAAIARGAASLVLSLEKIGPYVASVVEGLP
jgi:two-component system chemotaxis response regulator CheB